MIRIDPHQPEQAINIINEALAGDSWARNLEYIREARDLILNKYQFFPSLVEFVNNYKQTSTQKEKIVIREKRLFEEHTLTTKQMLYYQKKIIQYKLKNYKV